MSTVYFTNQFDISIQKNYFRKTRRSLSLFPKKKICPFYRPLKHSVALRQCDRKLARYGWVAISLIIDLFEIRSKNVLVNLCRNKPPIDQKLYKATPETMPSWNYDVHNRINFMMIIIIIKLGWFLVYKIMIVLQYQLITVVNCAYK